MVLNERERTIKTFLHNLHNVVQHRYPSWACVMFDGYKPKDTIPYYACCVVDHAIRHELGEPPIYIDIPLSYDDVVWAIKVLSKLRKQWLKGGDGRELIDQAIVYLTSVAPKVTDVRGYYIREYTR